MSDCIQCGSMMSLNRGSGRFSKRCIPCRIEHQRRLTREGMQRLRARRKAAAQVQP